MSEVWKLLRAVPKSNRLQNGARAQAATKLLEGTHVLSNGGIEDMLALANKTSPELEAKEQRVRILAEIIEGNLQKHEQFGTPISSPRMEQIKQQRR